MKHTRILLAALVLCLVALALYQMYKPAGETRMSGTADGTVDRADAAEAGDFPTPLAIEETGNSFTLETPYPEGYAIIHDAAFFNMIDGKFVVYDVDAPEGGFKGSVHGGMIGAFAGNPARNELYVATTYYTRGITGERADIVAVYDMGTLRKTAEILLPPKLMQSMPWKSRFRLSNDKRLAFVMNFTPAASVSIVDLANRKFLREIDIAGCSQVYPMGKTGFATICGDGTMLAIELSANGEKTSETRTEVFHDYDSHVMFMKNASLNGIAYFPTFAGNVQPVDLSGKAIKVLPPWSLLTDEEKPQNWRPGGLNFVMSDNESKFYILMHEDGAEGTHKNGGGEVWVYNAEDKKRTNKITLQTWGISLAVVGSKLLVTNAEMGIDVYDRENGQYVRTIGGMQTPFTLYTVDGR